MKSFVSYWILLKENRKFQFYFNMEVSNNSEAPLDNKTYLMKMLSDSSTETETCSRSETDKHSDCSDSSTNEMNGKSEILGSSDKISDVTKNPNNSELIRQILKKGAGIAALPSNKFVQISNKSKLVTGEYNERISLLTNRSDKAISMSGNTLFCEICEKTFVSQGGFKKHLRLHAGDVDHICSDCGKGFCFKSHLEAHMRIHTGEKPFECNTCQKKFTSNGDLKKHQLLHTGEKPFVCDICHKAFNQVGDLNIHTRIHTGVKPFVCGICHKGFTHKSNLTQHHRTHTGEKPYPCHFCGKYFSQNVQLNRHMMKHGWPKPFICPICKKGYTAKNRYVRHMDTHHSNKNTSTT